MSISADDAKLQQIDVDKIIPNKENPRLVFRSGELDELQESIRTFGVQVPIAVYKDKGRFVLIDGERRWRCCLKLNKPTIPALIQKKPGPLENLLLMFNIHALREQWDLLTIAIKLPDVIKLLKTELERTPTEAEISEKTGLKRGVIRRCKLLMNLPEKYREQILVELEKPKSKQRFTEDLFIELERALTTVERALPEVIPDRDAVRKILLKKFKNGVIDNRVLFRDMAKIARAEKVGGDITVAVRELRKLFSDNSYKIESAFKNSVEEAYAERDIGTRIQTFIGLLEDLEVDEIDAKIKKDLEDLVERVREFLRGAA